MSSRKSFTRVMQPDGSFCYSGPSCRRHGVYNRTQLVGGEDSLGSGSSGALVSGWESLFPTGVVTGLNHNNVRAEEFYRLVRSVRKQLTDAEIDLLKDYSMTGYLSINAFYRFGEEGIWENYRSKADRYMKLGVLHPSAVEEWVKKRATDEIEWLSEHIPMLEGIFDKVNCVGEPQLLYRALKAKRPDGEPVRLVQELDAYVQNTYKVGDVVEYNTPSSTSYDSDYMLGFARDDENAVLVHQIVTKQSGVAIGEPSAILRLDSIQEAEREMLLPPGLRFQVVGVERQQFVSSYPAGRPGGSYYGLAPQEKKFWVVRLVELE